jgi:hypothetical protein
MLTCRFGRELLSVYRTYCEETIAQVEVESRLRGDLADDLQVKELSNKRQPIE